MKWRHREGDDVTVSSISWGIRQGADIADDGTFESPDDPELVELLKDLGHEPLGDVPSEPSGDEEDTTYLCGAELASGGSCQRKVGSEDETCFQHG